MVPTKGIVAWLSGTDTPRWSRMKRRATIKDIADHLGISHSTVSRALADHPNTKEATKAKVRAAAAQLGYVADSAARLMRSGESHLLGLIIPDIRNDFYAALAKGLAQSCNEAGYQLVLAITEDDPISELRHVRELCEARAAGVAIVPGRDIRRETLGLLESVAAVQLIRHHPGIAGDWLGIDDRQSLRTATAHLLELGHRRIAYVGGDPQLSTGAARREGYREALASAGLPLADGLVFTGPPRAAFGREAVERLLAARPRPTAVVVAGARITQGVMEATEDHGIRVPHALSLVGFGDPPWFRWWHDGVTTLSLPVIDLALAAGSLLTRRVKENGGPTTLASREPTRVTYASQLIVRGSTGSPAGDVAPAPAAGSGEANP